jgi:hypothetical protein
MKFRDFLCKTLRIPTITPREWHEAFNSLVWYCIQRWMKEWQYSTNELLDMMKPYIEKMREYRIVADKLKEQNK